MKFIFLLIFVLIVPLSAQSQTVEVSQKLLDASNKAFLEVAALRDENAKLKAEVKEKDALIEALTNESAAKDVLIAEKNEVIVAQDAKIKLLEDRDKIRLKEIEALRLLKCDKDIWFFGLKKTIRCK